MSTTLDKQTVRTVIARRVARELRDGDFVNLGIGVPTLVPQYLPDDVHVVFEAEDGIVGARAAGDPGSAGARAAGRESEGDGRYVVDAGGRPAACPAGGAFIDSAMSFTLIRGGHVDVTVLGAMQVDEEANLANWLVPGRMVAGMGGAMDLVVGARTVIVAMEHTQRGTPKLVQRCTLPLTAVSCVDLIVTELGVFGYPRGRLTLLELNPACTLDELRSVTQARFEVASDLKEMG